jgi:hypothetical protein
MSGECASYLHKKFVSYVKTVGVGDGDESMGFMSACVFLLMTVFDFA